MRLIRRKTAVSVYWPLAAQLRGTGTSSEQSKNTNGGGFKLLEGPETFERSIKAKSGRGNHLDTAP